MSALKGEAHSWSHENQGEICSKRAFLARVHNPGQAYGVKLSLDNTSIWQGRKKRGRHSIHYPASTPEQVCNSEG